MTLPWGVPARSGTGLDKELPTRTWMVRFWRNEERRRISPIGSLMETSFTRIPSCHTESKAFSTSRETTVVL